MRWGALLFLVLLPGVMAHARVRHSESWARDRYAAAERMREALNGRPPADRTRHDYQRVLNAYRSVYMGSPTSTKADPSVVAVAETLVEMGRRFDDEKILKSAIAQYKFLRREYPGSKYRFDALFTIGEIYKDDLDDPDQARAAFQEFLHRYPHNRLAEDARQAIAELDQQAEADKSVAKESGDTDKPTSKDSRPDEGDSAPSMAKSTTPSSLNRSGHLPRVTGIRHWSTPDYTRVAIDLEDEVEFDSQRIAHPDRIYFDLRDTKLASTLVGKSFDVDDGFLKKIRVAQYQPGRTRVVLEVDDLSDYDAFLLPDPYRLIIDIHGKDIHGKDVRVKDKQHQDARGVSLKDAEESAKTADVEAPPKEGAESAVVPLADTETAGTKPDAHRQAVDGERPKANGRATAPVKKIVVEADDDGGDTSPVRVAKLEAPKVVPRSAGASLTPSSSSASRKAADEVSDTPSEFDDADPSSVDPAATTHPRGKSSQRSNKARKSLGDQDVHEARPTARGDRSLIRALGLKIGRIVIDPGHGGHDTGTIGPGGLEEKELVLDVGKHLGKLLETRLGAEVVYTRKDDTFIPLETRTAIANQQRADLFISIHANSSDDPAARGVETYYLNFTSSPEALEVAARENAVSEKSIHELQDLVKKIALKEKIEESREFASDVQESLHSGLAAKSPAIRNRGVKKAPFIVLIGANMPSILAEISFVSNPTDEHRLETSEYRQRIAESLYRGIAKYANGLSGVKVASKIDKSVDSKP